jgi:hypothetical protein
MEASQHSLLAACFTLHSINATLAIVPQRGAGLWISDRSNVCVHRAALCSFGFDLALAQMSPTAKKIHTHTSFYKYGLNELKGEWFILISLVNNILYVESINIKIRKCSNALNDILGNWDCGILNSLISQCISLLFWNVHINEGNRDSSSGRTMALGSTQPLTKMSTRNLKKKKRNLGVKCGRRVGLTTWPPSVSRLSK